HDIEVEGRQVAIDSGFIVFNDWTYPEFVAMLDELGVASRPTEMSFSVRCERTGLEYNGTRIDTLFSQRRNLVRPGFYRMLLDILKFNRTAIRARPRWAPFSRPAATRAPSSSTTWCPWAPPSGPPTRRACWTSRRGSSCSS